MTIERATEADIPALHALIESAYRGDSARRGWTHEADLLDGQRTDRDSLAAMLADPAQTILLLRDSATLVGCVAIANRGEGTAYLGMLTVDPARQAGGIGRRLIMAAEAHARAGFAATRVEMTVIALRTDLVAYYVRRGYAPTGERRPFPLDDPRFGRPRRDDLDFVVLARAV